MTRWRAIAMTTVLFGAVGPAIGAAVMSLQRPPGTVKNLVLLAYVFGGIPALIAGVAYGGLSARGNGSRTRWYARALRGAGAGLFGCLVFFLLVSAFDLLTVSAWSVRDVEIGFLRRLLLAGIPAGMLCALLTRSASASGES